MNNVSHKDNHNRLSHSNRSVPSEMSDDLSDGHIETQESVRTEQLSGNTQLENNEPILLDTSLEEIPITCYNAKE